MSMTMPVATMRITDGLREAEIALDEALLRQSELLTALVSTRIEVGGGAFEGQSLIMRLVKSQQSVIASANDLTRVHGGLLEIGREKSLIDDCPENGPIRTAGLKVA